MKKIYKKEELNYSTSREDLEMMLAEYNINKCEVEEKLDKIKKLPLTIIATVDHISWVPIDTEKEKAQFMDLLFLELEDKDAVAVAKEEREECVVFVISNHKRVFVSYYDGDEDKYGVRELTEGYKEDYEDLN